MAKKQSERNIFVDSYLSSRELVQYFVVFELRTKITLHIYILGDAILILPQNKYTAILFTSKKRIATWLRNNNNNHMEIIVAFVKWYESRNNNDFVFVKCAESKDEFREMIAHNKKHIFKVVWHEPDNI